MEMKKSYELMVMEHITDISVTVTNGGNGSNKAKDFAWVKSSIWRINDFV